MIIVHTPSPAAGCFDRHVLGKDEALPAEVVWIDLIEPTPVEERMVESFLGVQILTREEMQDIEPSEIIYTENESRFMTARVLCHSDTASPKLVAVLFVLTPKVLLTVRYDEPRSFSLFVQRIGKSSGLAYLPEAVLDGLIETIIDRAADVLQRVGTQVEDLALLVFERDAAKLEANGGYNAVIRKLGRQASLISNVRESMVSLERILLFLQANYARPAKRAGFEAEWKTAARDVQSIEDHATFLASKVQFNLEATLGLVNLEQSRIIKIFSVAAVIFLPPTLIASSYGMNFRNMPELDWWFGYPLAILLMICSAAGTYTFFKRKGWL